MTNFSLLAVFHSAKSLSNSSLFGKYLEPVFLKSMFTAILIKHNTVKIIQTCRPNLQENDWALVTRFADRKLNTAIDIKNRRRGGIWVFDLCKGRPIWDLRLYRLGMFHFWKKAAFVLPNNEISFTLVGVLLYFLICTTYFL